MHIFNEFTKIHKHFPTHENYDLEKKSNNHTY